MSQKTEWLIRFIRVEILRQMLESCVCVSFCRK